MTYIYLSKDLTTQQYAAPGENTLHTLYNVDPPSSPHVAVLLQGSCLTPFLHLSFLWGESLYMVVDDVRCNGGLRYAGNLKIVFNRLLVWAYHLFIGLRSFIFFIDCTKYDFIVLQKED